MYSISSLWNVLECGIVMLHCNETIISLRITVIKKTESVHKNYTVDNL